MSNDGTSLERIVADIEERLLPAGFSVELRKGVWNDDGVKIAEFDIDITGRVGSSDVHWLIECRDRPSGGPAPASWIEQLVGRRQRFGIDRVFAVSTTGFASGAAQFATDSHIILRRVDDITSIPSAFLVRNMEWVDDDVLIAEDVSFFDDATGAEIVAALSELHVDNGSGFLDVGDFIFEDLENTQAYQRRNQQEITREDLIYNNQSEMNAVFRGTPMRIRGITTRVKIRMHPCISKVLLCRQYAEDNRVIGQVGDFEFTDRSGPQRCTIKIAIDGDGRQHFAAILPDGSEYRRTFDVK